MVEIKWTNQSIEDINNIAEYIANDSAKFANIQTSAFFEASEILLTYPLAGRFVPEIKNKNIRELIIGNYRLIYYIIDSKNIHVLTVHHSSRLLKSRGIKKSK
jgi:addiction module RelE/StbE family toxin